MDNKELKKKIRRAVKTARRRNPIEIKRSENGIQLKKVDTSFNPKKEDHSGRVYLCIVDGMDTTVKEVEKSGDDMVLQYEDKYCAITSKPLLIEGNQLYFTKHGFVGTMALNKDTLLGGDVFQETNEDIERRISKDIDLKQIPFDVQAKAHNEDEEYYYVMNSEVGDVASLHGSKKTLKDVNKAKRLRKLLQPSSMDKKQLLMALGSGIAVGFYLYPQIQ